jgi:GWxTD domain-containing protein
MRADGWCIRFMVLAVFASSLSMFGQENSGQLTPEYEKWIKEDVGWIIKPGEQRQFLALATDKERDQFIVKFWEHRNPTPGTTENPFKDEHYRRLSFANQHFAENRPGWKTDRGRVYIVYGPPDVVTKHAGSAIAAPEEIWSYMHMKVGDTVFVRFVDECRCGKFSLKTELPVGMGD